MKIVRFIRNMTCLVLLFCLCLCGYLLWSSSEASREQSRFMESIVCYKPLQTERLKTETDVLQTTERIIEETIQSEQSDIIVEETLNKSIDTVQDEIIVEEPIINQSIIDMQEKYPDVLGWLTLDSTAIDYPFVQSHDNEDYLRTDLDGNYLLAGTIFADCRCDISSSFITILYGHNFKDSTMFGDIGKFADDEFWAKNTTGTLCLPYETYQMQIIAYLVVASSDSDIYAPYIDTESEIVSFQEYLARNARKYRATDLAVNDRVLALSTCNYEFTGARSVLIIKLVSDNSKKANEQSNGNLKHR